MEKEYFLWETGDNLSIVESRVKTRVRNYHEKKKCFNKLGE